MEKESPVSVGFLQVTRKAAFVLTSTDVKETTVYRGSIKSMPGVAVIS